MSKKIIKHDDKVEDTCINRAVEYAIRMEKVEKMTGIRVRSVRRIRSSAWTDGFEEGVEAAGKGELLEESTALHHQMFDLDMEQKNLLALVEFADEVRMEVFLHKEECDCPYCKALHTLDSKRVYEE